MANIDFGTGPNTASGDTVAEALVKLQDRLDALGTGTPAPSPSLSLSSAVTLTEGDSGATAFIWTLTLNRDGSSAAFPFSWSVTATGANPANAADFGGTFPTGTATFASGETSKTISVPVTGDTAVEPSETFMLTVTAAGLNTVTSTGTISNDDTAPAAPQGFALNGSTNPALKAMLARVAAGTGRGKIVLKGDSITAGAGGPIVSGTAANVIQELTDARKYRVSATLASQLASIGYPALDHVVADNHSATFNVDLFAYDPRLTSTGTPWSVTQNHAFAGGGFIQGTSGSLTYTETANMFEIIAYNATTSVAISIDGSAVASSALTVDKGSISGNTITGTGANNGFARYTVAAGAVGSHQLGLTAGGTNPILYSIRALNTAVKAIDIINHAASGAVSADQAASNVGGYNWSNMEALVYEAPDLTIINLAANDVYTGASLATHQTNIQAIITKAKLSGDVLLVSPNPASPTGNTPRPTATQIQFRDADAILAASNGIAYMDLYTYFGADWSTFSSRSSDGGIHGNRGVYAEMGEVYRRCIQAMAA